jgi:hypothetical protein
MNEAFVRQRVTDFLRAMPSGATYTPFQLLALVFPNDDWTKRTKETTTVFRMLRRLGNGPLAHLVTHPGTFTMGGKECRTYIWHSRPQAPTPGEEPIQGMENAGLDLRLARIEERLGQILWIMERFE